MALVAAVQAGGCHAVCWMAPFMIADRMLRSSSAGLRYACAGDRPGKVIRYLIRAGM